MHPKTTSTAARRLTAFLLALTAAGAPRQAAAQTFDVVEATTAQAHDAMRSGALTCRALVQGYLARIEAYDQKGPHLNAVQTVNPRALALADSLDAVLASGAEVGALHCVPVLLKDQVETRDMPTTYGSVLFKHFMSQRDATIVRRMRAAGAIILAKTNMGEFASRYVGSAYGIIRNPYDPDRNPSGSSGGTAAGIAASFGMVGIGEDTGGSVRGPAAVTNLVGLRPTLQLVSTWGMMPANPTQDTMGPICRTVTDAAVLLDVIAGYDPNQPLTAYAVGHVPDSYTTALDAASLRGARIGVLREPQDPGTDPGSEDYRKVHAVFDAALRDLRSAGADVVDPVSLPEIGLLAGLGNDFETEEATDAYLAQLVDPPFKTLGDILLTGRVNPWRARGIMGLMGKTTDDPGYLQVMLKREVIRQGVLKAMADNGLDALVYATFDHQPTLIAPDVETNPRPDDGYGWGDNRGLSPAIGFPALTVPAGFTSDALPVGLEFLGRPFTEAELLGFGYAYEQATAHRRGPTTTPPLGPGRRR
ncbi:MAG TPA: amidase family protein [Longimicrobiales bacterium]|nr:amidase family protein [Longimicrobiales bacterium]